MVRVEKGLDFILDGLGVELGFEFLGKEGGKELVVVAQVRTGWGGVEVGERGGRSEEDPSLFWVGVGGGEDEVRVERVKALEFVYGGEAGCSIHGREFAAVGLKERE